MLRADGNLVGRVRNPLVADVTQLGRVSRVYGNDPATILGDVMGESVDECTPVPPAVLHRIANPAEVFHGDDCIAVEVRQVGDFLCRKDS